VRRLLGRARRALATKRAAQLGGALACFGAGTLVFLFAADVARWDRALAADDVRYTVSPESPDLWQPGTLLPARLSRDVLGVGDDVDFRLAVRSLRLSRLEEPIISIPEIALRRNDAQARLGAIAGRSGDAARRSRAAGLLGVLGIARLVTETRERTALLESAVTNLQLAIALDPQNDEAKFNLELALQRGRGIQLTEGAGGPNPDPGGAGAKGAGAGDPGSGY
jgi:hypothetical protein